MDRIVASADEVEIVGSPNGGIESGSGRKGALGAECTTTGGGDPMLTSTLTWAIPGERVQPEARTKVAIPSIAALLVKFDLNRQRCS
jgi:hypothetical protein